MKVNTVQGLIAQYGANTTLEELLKKVQGDKIYKCPCCNGLGYTTKEYNGYPSGLPDSGWVYEPAYKNVTCELCNGEGYTEREYKPKMVQQGWE